MSAPPLVAFFERDGQRPDALLPPRVLRLQADCLARGLRDFTSLGGMGQTLVPPWGIGALADLVLGAPLGHRFARETFKDDQRLGFRVPCASWQS